MRLQVSPDRIMVNIMENTPRNFGTITELDLVYDVGYADALANTYSVLL